ncbi:helix-turn-helix domain-containing protein [Micromonospora carbonacea]|uniref:Helix-turn-helix domain-containing protein n=1 Tax=Micromonospora carbonacea TaxID=47853 RepID=A0A7H8XJ62_9ACTN|nr:helix-turn-helix domain-containing protein [Micromonospora carbonacea]MBB5828561.1 GAF domain-containing protein [Micromonospora carbonacea]QLD23842.1 helix-turn-helix domain-containing protein [Micromonospora carbonacea]
MTGTSIPPRDHELRFFELLAREAPLPQYEELVHQAHRDGVDQATLDRVMIAKRLALELREVIGRRCQRQAELAALVDTARDLAGATNLEAGLQLVVRRTQLLLAGDVAFVSLVDDATGESYVASAVGAATALTSGYRLPWRDGLVVAAAPREPLSWTADHLADERLERHPAADGLVRAEGLHAVLSVVLSVEGRHLGNLHVGHRQVRHFAPDEVASLRLLADLAATAVERIMLLDDTWAELKQAQQEAARARAELNAVRMADRLQPELVQLILDGGELDDLVGSAVRRLGGALHVRDRANGVLAAAGEIPVPNERELARVRLNAHATGRPGRLTTGSWVVPLAARAGDLGCVLFHADEPSDDERMAALPAVAQTVALLMTRNGGSHGQPGDGLLEDLLGPWPDLERGGKRRRYTPVEFDRPYVVVVARPEGATSPRVFERAVSVAHGLNGMKAIRDGQAVLLLPGDDPGARARDVTRELSGLLGLPVTAGGAGPVRTADSVSRTYQEAARCVDALAALDAKGRAACSRDLGFLGLLVAGGHDVTGFVDRVIGPVLSYDARRLTNLRETLQTYFDSAGSRTRAAEMLHLHPNTVSRRLDRISQLLGRDWRQPDRALDTQLALRLHRIRGLLCQERGYPGPSQEPDQPARPIRRHRPPASAGRAPRTPR